MQLKLVNRGESAEVLMIGRLDVNAAQEVEKAKRAKADAEEKLKNEEPKLEQRQKEHDQAKTALILVITHAGILNLNTINAILKICALFTEWTIHSPAKLIQL